MKILSSLIIFSLRGHFFTVIFSLTSLAAVAAVTPGAQYEFDTNKSADLAAWSNTGFNAFEDFSQGPYAVPPVAVSEPGFAGIVAAYDTSAIAIGEANGVANAYENGLGSRGSATFEFWIRVDDTQTNQIVAEFGGSGRGTLFAIGGGNLEFYISGDASAGVSAPVSTGWQQVVGTFDNTSGAMELFIDGASVATGGVSGINDWAGGNPAGLGNRGAASHATGSATFGATVDADAPFQGLISVYRFYRWILSSNEIQANYLALNEEPPPPLVVTWAAGSGDWSTIFGDLGSGETAGVGAAADGSGQAVTFTGIPATEVVSGILIGHDNVNQGHGTLVVEAGDLEVTGDITAGRSTPANDGFLEIRGGTLTIGGDMRFGVEADAADGSLVIAGGGLQVAGNLELGDFYIGGSTLRFHNPGTSPPVAVGGLLRLGRCSLGLTFDDSYIHDPDGGDLVLATYGSRDAQFLNARRGEVFTSGPNRFRVNYDVDLGGGQWALTLTPLPNHAPTTGPNIVLIFADDQGYHDLGMQGDPTFPSPEIDALSSAGVRFTEFYVTASVCHPSRVGLLTGRHGQRMGTDGNLGNPDSALYNGMASSQRTVPRRLQAMGYRTYGIGKWHLGETAEFHPLQRGFDEWYGIDAGSRSYDGPNYDSAFTESTVFQEGENPVPEDEGPYVTDRIGDKAVEFIANHVASGTAQPFFLYVSFTAVHGPMHWTEERLQRLENEFGISIDPDARDLVTNALDLPASARRDILRAMTLALDENVGKILDTLANPDGNSFTEDGILSNTLVVYANDNGGSEDDFPSPIGGDNASNNFPLRGQKGGLFEGGIRVPAALTWPGIIPAGQTISEPVTALDLAATFVNAGGDAPPQVRNRLDGIDLLPLLRDSVPLPEERALCWRRRGTQESQSVIRKGDWKLLIDDTTGNKALFNLAADIGESTNLAASEPDKVAELFRDFQIWESQLLTPFYNGAGVEFEAGLERRAAADGYRILNRDAAVRWMTTILREGIDPAVDFRRSLFLRPSEASHTTGDQLWFGLGDDRTPSNFIQVGIDFGSGELTLAEGRSVGNAQTVALAPEDLTDGFRRLDLAYDESAASLEVSFGTTATSLSLNGSYTALDTFGYGAVSMEGEFSPPFDPDLAPEVETSILKAGPDEMVIEARFQGNAVFVPQAESSLDLDIFQPDSGAIVEHLGAGRYRMTVTVDPETAREFFRLNFNEPPE